MRGFCFGGQQDWDDPGTCTKVSNFAARCTVCKGRQQNSIHTETEFIGILNNIIIIDLKIVQAFSRS